MKPKRSTSQKTTETPNPPQAPCDDLPSQDFTCLWITNGQVCNQKCDSPSDLLSHIETKHAPHGLVCFWQDCPKKQHVYSETRNFRNHLTDHTGEKSYECSVCHIKLSRSGMAKHRQNIHPIQGIIDPKSKSSPTPATKCSWEKNGEKCSYDCQDPADLIKHIDSTHIDATQICYWKGCRQLQKPIFVNSLERKKSVLQDEKAFLNHVRSHTGYQPYKCQHCPKAFAMEYKLVEHLRSEHPEMKPKRSTNRKTTSTSHPPELRDLTCQWVTNKEVCNHVCQSPSELILHILSIHKPPTNNFVCLWKDCDKNRHTYTQKRDFLSHLSNHTGEKLYECIVCHRKFSRCGLWRHRSTAHPGIESQNVCLWMTNGEQCSYEARDAAELAEHVRSFHHNATDFMCHWNTCLKFKPLTDARTFLCHILGHTGHRPCECQQCHKTFVMEYKLDQHLKHDHTEPSSEEKGPHFFCDWNNEKDFHFAGATAVELTNHIISFHKPEVDNFVCHWKNCSLQPGQIKSKREFILHFRQEHNKEDKPYDCPECESSFPWKSRLDWHKIQVHKEVKPHDRCYWMKSFSLCTQVCRNPTELREHVEKMHTEDCEKFVCRWDGCWMEFTQAQDLVKHLSRHTGEKIHDKECSICHEKFTRSGLEKHRRLDHKDHERVKRKPDKKRAAQKNDVDSKDNEIHEQQAKRPHKKRPPATAPTNPSSDSYECTQQIGAIDGCMPIQQTTSPDAPQDANYTGDDTQSGYAEYSDYEGRESFQEEARDVRYPQYVDPEYVDVGNMPGPSNDAGFSPEDDFGFGFERL